MKYDVKMCLLTEAVRRTNGSPTKRGLAGAMGELREGRTDGGQREGERLVDWLVDLLA